METIQADMNEILFENRNKLYGAYALRKSYEKHLLTGMVLASTLFILFLCVPLINQLFKGVKEEPPVKLMEDGGVLIRNIVIEPPIVAPVIQPPVVNSSVIKSDQIVFVHDKVMPIETKNTVLQVPEGAVQGTTTLPGGNIAAGAGETVASAITAPIITKEPPPVADVMPQFPGGDEALRNYLQKNVHYPRVAIEGGIAGVVFLNFVIEEDGSLSNIKILRGIGGTCDQEAIRVVKNMPKWIAGKNGGKSLAVQCNLPIKFVLK